MKSSKQANPEPENRLADVRYGGDGEMRQSLLLSVYGISIWGNREV
jgi:hypothetical protein